MMSALSFLDAHVDALTKKVLGSGSGQPPLPLVVKLAVPTVALFLLLRIAQRLYYAFRGHTYDWWWTARPRHALEAFFKKHDVRVEDHTIVCTRDGKSALLKYRRLGTGKRVVLLANGVGTDLFMWLPTLRAMVAKNPRVFEEMTLIAPSYRGLFGCDAVPTPVPPPLPANASPTTRATAVASAAASAVAEQLTSLGGKLKAIVSPSSKPSTAAAAAADAPAPGSERVEVPPVEITMALLVEDVVDVMRHAKVGRYHTIVGWSLGAQVALTAVAKYPHITHQLLLLNPSSGETIGHFSQSLAPYPAPVRRGIARAMFNVFDVLLPLIPTDVWVGLKAAALSTGFRVFLECLAFFGGFPPEQPPYFAEYMRDVFNTRDHTRGLLLLIKALDAPLPDAALALPHKAMILSGLPDNMTGVFHAFRLHASMPNARHIMFTMASHFLLIEWPDLLADEILNQVSAD
jgi:pimeloyl-ACP methyl ester carboxylesterase